MIVTEFFRTRKDGVTLYRTYSDDNRYIVQEQTGAQYVEAIDIENRGYTYVEGDVIKEEIKENEFLNNDNYEENQRIFQ